MPSHETQRALLVQIQDLDGTWLDVGVLHNANEVTWFESSGKYWETPNRPVLGQVFEERGRDWTPSTRVAIPSWFSHLLPEGLLRQAVSRAARVNEKREFFLLSRIGLADLQGAIRVRPWEASPVMGPSNTHGTDPEDEEADSPFLKYSLAGVQLKFSVRHHHNKGLTIPARGQAGDWIVKLPDGRPNFDGVPEAELGSLELARRIGIDVPETGLIQASSIDRLPDWVVEIPGMSLTVKRYDRSAKNQRIHSEELAQILNVPTGNENYKYRRANFETIANTIGALCGPEDAGEVIRRIVLNVLLGNGDAHLKNWSVIYPDGRLPRLSPAYDILPTVLYIPDDDLGLNLNGSKRFDTVTSNSFDRLALRAGWDIPKAHDLIASTIQRIANEWPLLKEYLSKERYELLSKRRGELNLFLEEQHRRG